MPRPYVVVLLVALVGGQGPAWAAPARGAERRSASFKGQLSAQAWKLRARFIPTTRANLERLEGLAESGLRAKAIGNVVVMRRYRITKHQGRGGIMVEDWVRLRQADASQALSLPKLGGKPQLAGKALRQGLEHLIKKAVLAEPTQTKLLDAAVKGVLDEKPLRGAEVYRRALVHAAASLGDKYTAAFTPVATVANTKRRQSKKVGVGVRVKMVGGAIEVDAAFDNTPAGRVLQKGDRLLAVDGKRVSSVAQAAKLLSGTEGTPTRIVYERNGRSREASLVRQEYRAPQVSWHARGSAVVVKLAAFRDGITQEIVDAVDGATAQLGRPPRGVVLDLRGNLGGLVIEARRLISLFTQRSKLFALSYREEAHNGFGERDGEARFSRMPLTILVDGNSASASEIVTGALGAMRRAKVLGDKTFGKGIQQGTYDLVDESSVKITNAFIEIFDKGDTDRPLRYHGKGFTPSYGSAQAKRDFPAAKDPLVEAALQQLGR